MVTRQIPDPGQVGGGQSTFASITLAFRTRLTPRRALFTLFGALLATACAEAHPAEPVASRANVEPEVSSEYDRDVLITDGEMLDASAMSAEQIDAFLARPYPQVDNQPSCLSKLSFAGKTVGQLIAEKSQKYRLNPLFLLTHLQKESSLVGATGTCDAALVAQAFGCGCPGSGPCAPQFAGFPSQIECAAGLTRSYLDEMDRTGMTLSGWGVNRPKTTRDHKTITPSSRAAAVLYTYTPWVGDRSDSGNTAPFGNYLFWKTYRSFVKSVGYKGPSRGLER